MKRFQILLACLAVVLGGSVPATAFTASDADAIFNGYNTAFYATNASGNCYYKNATTGGQTWFWAQAEEIEALLDYYDRRGDASTKTKITQICNGFIDQNGSSWTWNKFNDDITWAVIAFSRAYLATGNSTFRNVAKANFDAMYARAWDTNFAGGGLWWSTDNAWKAGCINGPGTVAACYLYSIYGDSAYLKQAQAIYAWERKWLFHTDSGAIYDGIGTDYNYGTWVSTYNQGTFIGAGNFLYQLTGLPFYYQDAILAAKCTQNSLCSSDGIFPEYGSGDYGGFNGIGARWIGRLTRDQNLWTTFGAWLNANANAAWSVRNENNLAWEKWKTPTPGGTNELLSWDCSDSVVIMQVGMTNVADALQITPAVGFAAATQRGFAPAPINATLFLTNTEVTAFNWSLANTSAWLTASANSGTLAGGSTASVLVSLVPAATTNLAAGRYYGSILVTNLASGAVQVRTFLLAISAAGAPIALTGYNAGVLAPNTATAGSLSAFDIPNNYAFYQAGLNGGTRGLPPDGLFTSQADATTVFQFVRYGTLNTLVLGNTYPNSGTLTLATPRAYNSLSVLACSANASGGTGTFVLNFTNGTQSQTFNFSAPDWFNTSTNVAIQGFGRLKLNASSLGTEDNGASNPNLYQTTLDLAALGISQPVASITFTKPANAGSQQTCGIFAVSGTSMPAPANIVQSPLSATNDQPAQAATFNVVASGIPPLAYQWYYSTNGDPGTFAPLIAQTNSRLVTIPAWQTNRAGNFFVVVTNNYGSATSAVATLTVYLAPVITQQPTPTNLWRFSGQTNLWSVAANAALPVNYYWRKNGTNLPAAVGSAYELDNLQITHSGNYTVVISNAFGSVTSSPVALTVVPAPTYPCGQMQLADGALGYWRLDETSGTLAHDYLNGNNGTYTPTVLLGQPGNRLLDVHTAARFGYLAASNSCITNLPVDFATSGNAAFSVAAWVNGGAQTTDAGLVTKGYGGGGEQFNLDCGGKNHAFRFFVRDAGGNTHVAASSVVPDNQWHHLVGICDETKGFIYLYVDGTNAAQATVGAYVGILSASTPASIGSRQSAAGKGYDYQFVGSIEEVAIYRYALSSNQVAAYYQGATNRAPAFLSNPLTFAAATAGQLYSANLLSRASDPNGDQLTFAKLSGPDWLSVASDGSLLGTPGSGNVGANGFVVKATDPGGLADVATVNLTVMAAPPIVTTAVLQGTNLLLSWTGGVTPYQVQMATNLSDATWQNLGSAMNANAVVTPLTNGAAFYRIQSQ